MSYAQDKDVNENMIPDILEQSKVALQQQKQVYEQVQKDKELQLKNQVENKKVEIEKQKLNVKEKEIQAKKGIEKLKAETALKVAKENKTKAELSRSRNK